jgi:hypothetical protein
MVVEQRASLSLPIDAERAHYGRMMRPPDKDVGSLDLDGRCRAASEAYHIACDALDAGLRRKSGATAREWKAEFDARVELRHARAAFVAASKRYTAISKAELRVSARELDRPHAVDSVLDSSDEMPPLEQSKETELDEGPLCRAGDVLTTDDQMIQQSHLHQVKSLRQLQSDAAIRHGRLRNP